MIRVLLLLLIVGLSIFLLTEPSPFGEGFAVAYQSFGYSVLS